jgi:hypothetical protein
MATDYMSMYCYSPSPEHESEIRNSKSEAFFRPLDFGPRISGALLVILAFISTTAIQAALSQSQVPAAVHQFVIGVSPFLDKIVKDDVFRGIVRLMVQDLPLDSSLSIYDAFELKTITQLSLPDVQAFNSPKTRANQFAGAIGDLKKFLADEHPRAANSKLKFDNALRLPQFWQFLGEHSGNGNTPIVLLLLGSPLYEDSKETAFSMVDGYFPSDGHLQASREQTIFGFTEEGDNLRSCLVHWAYFGDPWINELHREKVTRFWTLYLEKRHAPLLTFSSDLPSAFAAFRQGEADSQSASRHWMADSRDTKLEMLRVSRKVDLADWLTGESLPDSAPSPPTALVGPLKIGIRWKEYIDLDLYATPRHGAETLFFQHTRSPEGYYNRDHRSSPGHEYEFIEFESPVDVRELEASVNFYEGSCPGGPRGEVRIEFEGRLYSGAFSIRAGEGNLGRSGPSQRRFWTRIPVLELLGIPPLAER